MLPSISSSLGMAVSLPCSEVPCNKGLLHAEGYPMHPTGMLPEEGFHP